MGLVPLNSPLFFPPVASAGVNSAPAFGTTNINTIGHRIGCVFVSPVTDTITHIAFRTASINAGDLSVRVETYDTATGYATGTLWDTDTSGTITVLATDDNQTFEVALTSPASVNKGDYVCLIVQAETTSIGSVSAGMTAGANAYTFPMAFTNLGSYAGLAAQSPVTAPKFGTNGYVYMDMMTPIKTVTLRSYNSGSTPDVRGLKITVPYSCTVGGFWATADIDGNATARLLAADGSTVLTSVSMFTNVPPVSSATRVTYPFASEVTLSAGDVVYLTIEPTSGSNMGIYELGFESTDIKKVWCENAVAVSAKDPTQASDYTEVATSGMAMGLIITAIETGLSANPVKGFIA